jgi:hypothetical protein
VYIHATRKKWKFVGQSRSNASAHLFFLPYFPASSFYLFVPYYSLYIQLFHTVLTKNLATLQLIPSSSCSQYADPEDSVSVPCTREGGCRERNAYFARHGCKLVTPRTVLHPGAFSGRRKLASQHAQAGRHGTMRVGVLWAGAMLCGVGACVYL